jgi:hypothetical protein
MYAWLKSLQAETRCLELGKPGIEVEIAALERLLGVSLAPSQRAFLLDWNGAANFCGYEILSVQQLLEAIDVYDFRPSRGQSEQATNANYPPHRARQACHLPVIRPHDSADLICLNTRTGSGEYPVVHYDHQDGSSRREAPSFEAWMLQRALNLAGDLEAFLDPDAGDDDAVYHEIEGRLSRWEDCIRQTLVERGADLTDPWRPRWDNWRGFQGKQD